MEPNEISINLLNLVPNEIWKACWTLVPRNDLKNLSRVCQVFRPICQSLLFETFTISISRIAEGGMFTLAESDMTIIQEKIKALKGLIANQFLVNSVRRLVISAIYLETALNGPGHLFTKSESGESPLILFLATLINSLPSFSRIKALILECPLVLSVGDSDCLSLILRLASALRFPIEYLTLIMEDVPSRTFDEFSSLKVLSLGKPSYKHPEDPQPDTQILIPTSIEYLFANSVVIAPKILLGLNGLHQNLISFELRLGRSSFPLLLQSLPFCPEMKYIVIHSSSRTICTSPLQLSETSIPKLKTFIGPLELALVIVPNRPVNCLAIIEEPWEKSTNDTILHDMTQLARSTGPVTKLTFTLDINQRGTLPTIVNLFPTLSLLNISFHDEELPLNARPENGVQVRDGRLEVERKWKDADSLEHFAPAENSFGYKGLIYAVSLGRLQLPSTLENLRLDIHLNPHYMIGLDELERDFYYFEPFTFLMARRVVYASAKRYPHLRQVHIGYKKGIWIWVKDREQIWQAKEERLLI